MSALLQNTYKKFYPDWSDDSGLLVDETEVRHVGGLEDIIQYAPMMTAHYIKSADLFTNDFFGYRFASGLNLRIEKRTPFYLRTSEQAHSQSVRSVFETCLVLWKEETKLYSSLHTIVFNKHYQRIIGLGPDVLPYIFDEYRKNGGLWHNALEAITGENPITEDCVGRARKIQETWINWAKLKGYV